MIFNSSGVIKMIAPAPFFINVCCFLGLLMVKDVNITLVLKVLIFCGLIVFIIL